LLCVFNPRQQQSEPSSAMDVSVPPYLAIMVRAPGPPGSRGGSPEMAHLFRCRMCRLWVEARHMDLSIRRVLTNVPPLLSMCQSCNKMCQPGLVHPGALFRSSVIGARISTPPRSEAQGKRPIITLRPTSADHFLWPTTRGDYWTNAQIKKVSVANIGIGRHSHLVRTSVGRVSQ
jgi:hypothetical protein